MADQGDPGRAAGQQAYMKSAMPYHGLRNNETRTVCKEVFEGYEFEAEKWRDDVLAIWNGAKFREERYAAIERTQVRKAKPLHTIDALPMMETMITTGAWWDYVDTLASHNLLLILEADTKKMTRTMLRWAKDDDMWKRRSSILCQLQRGEETDLDLLYRAIEPSIESKEFFLRKAIGWALRQYARTDPVEVARYVELHRDRLSPLSVREALKHL